MKYVTSLRWSSAVRGSLLTVLLSTTLPVPVAADVADAFGDPVLLRDLQPGTSGSRPFGYVSLGDRALFLTSHEVAGRGVEGENRLWGTDGTNGGTVPLPPDADIPFPIHAVSPDGSSAFYNAVDRQGGDAPGSLWVTDGTVAGTMELADGVVLEDFDEALPHFGPDGHLYFVGRTGDPETHDLEPWVSDGTPEGTFRLADTIPGPDQARIGEIVSFRGEVYFTSFDPDSGRPALWKSDGTTVGTVVAAVLMDGAADFGVLEAAGSSLYLAGTDRQGFSAVWRSDGTPDGTVKLARLGDAGYGGGPFRAYFVADLSDASGDRTVWRALELGSPGVLWRLDGTPGGAERIGETTPGSIGDAVVLDGVAYFRADTVETGTELFRTDGTAAGTGPVVDWCPGPCSGIGDGPVVFAGRLLLSSQQGTGTGSEPLVSDGTAAGTRLLADLCAGPSSSGAGIRSGSDLGYGYAFVAAGAGTARQVWVTDLTPEGTVRLTGFPGGVASSDVRRAGDRLVFSVSDAATGVEPWTLPFFGLGGDPPLPPGPWHTGPGLPGFEVKARIRAGGETIATAVEPECIPETLCLSGALPGRSELFVRIVGPKPNGFLWPTLVKFSTSEIEVWIRQTAPGPTQGEVRYYRLEGASPGFDELPGLFDRDGFRPLS